MLGTTRENEFQGEYEFSTTKMAAEHGFVKEYTLTYLSVCWFGSLPLLDDSTDFKENFYIYVHCFYLKLKDVLNSKLERDDAYVS